MSTTPNNPPTGAKRPQRLRWTIVEWLEQRVNLTEIFSIVTNFGIVYTPVDTRRPLREAMTELAETPLVSYAQWPQVLGLLTALLFALEAVTGVLLAFYYHPTSEGAYASTAGIVRDVPLGWFVHQMHNWGAYLLIAVVVLRVLRFFWDRLYEAPREMLWITAVLLMWVVLQLDFTGRLLPYDVKSYWSAMRGLEIVCSQPVVGPFISFVLGGHVITENVLLRCYVLHVVVLPLIYLVGIYLTFATMRRIGIHVSAEGGDLSKRTTWRKHTLDFIIFQLLLFAGLVTLATLLPFRFHGPADPFSTPAGTRPPWYLLSVYTLNQYIPGPTWIAGTLMLLFGLALPVVPLWSAANPQRLGAARLRQAGLALFSVWAVLTVLGEIVGRR
jgi:quinol-cytochrome oxidoreductase complex cytochrome b subunit